MMLPVIWVLMAAVGCESVSGDRITARDFTRVAPEFSVLPESVSFGFAPLPGARRNFTAADVQKIARQYGIQTAYRDSLCFEWPMRRLERPEVVTAMGDTLGQSGVQVEEYSLFPAPPGLVVFPLSGLSRRTEGSSFWRGYVQYAPDKRFNIWAKVKMDGVAADKSIADVMGGSRVTVLVRSGAAELKFEAQAITSGSKGQTVTVRNPRSGRSFAAEVVGKDNVLVAAGETPK
jgi:Chaperone for flagella basal body P-ring formation